MKDIEEIKRLDSPAPKPTSLAWDGTILWMGSRQTKRIYGINPATWAVVWETAAPGTPYGIASMEIELRVVCGETAGDNRFIRRCIPMHGFDTKFAIPCPDDTGSQLGYDGRRLHLSQWYPRKVLALGADGQVERVISVPHGICGQVFVRGLAFDGERFWTNHREQNQIVSFARPGRGS